jgi:MFS transporter, OFA family, oxalate/formate antiporter
MNAVETAGSSNTAGVVPPWRYVSVVLGAAIGLGCSFPIVFNSSLPFFLLPLSQEFGWGRGDTSTAAVLAMLGVTLASPFVGRLFDRFGIERVIVVSVLLFAAAVYSMSYLPGSLAALGALCFVVGVAGSGTSMVGYAGVLPRWFDQRLGLALGIAGLGAGLGVGLSPFVATRLVTELGWRGAFAALAGIALVGGLLAYVLLRPRRGERAPLVVSSAVDLKIGAHTGSAAANATGLTVHKALRDPRFWLLFAVTFVLPFSILGIALHGAALFIDRGLTAGQAATGAALAGLGAIIARVGVGALLDRWHAPLVAVAVIVGAAAGLALNSWASTFALLCVGTFLGGAAMGAEGDLLPFFIRRYFGLRAFGTLFGAQYSAYALGGVLGPIAYGYTFDTLNTYSPIMVICAIACLVSAAAIGLMGPYRYGVGSDKASSPIGRLE